MEREDKWNSKEDKIFGLINFIVSNGYLPAKVRYSIHDYIDEPCEIEEASSEGARFVDSSTIHILELERKGFFARLFGNNEYCVLIGKFCLEGISYHEGAARDSSSKNLSINVYGRDNLRKIKDLSTKLSCIGWDVREVSLKSEYAYKLKGGT